MRYYLLFCLLIISSYSFSQRLNLERINSTKSIIDFDSSESVIYLRDEKVVGLTHVDSVCGDTQIMYDPISFRMIYTIFYPKSDIKKEEWVFRFHEHWEITEYRMYESWIGYSVEKEKYYDKDGHLIQMKLYNKIIDSYWSDNCPNEITVYPSTQVFLKHNRRNAVVSLLTYNPLLDDYLREKDEYSIAVQIRVKKKSVLHENDIDFTTLAKAIFRKRYYRNRRLMKRLTKY